MVFGCRLTLLRKERGVKQAELAKNLGLSRGAVSSWEKGKTTPDYETLIKIAKFFGVPVDYLLGLTDCKTTYPPSQVKADIDIDKLNDLPVEARKSIAEFIELIGKRYSKGEK